MERGADEAEAVFRRAARSERLWPLALAALVLYVPASSWGFVRGLGTTGRLAHVQAAPSLWVVLAVGAVVAGAHLGRWVDSRAGQPPWRWPRRARRVLVVLVIALPVLAFGVAPIAAILAVDAGSTTVAPAIGLLVDVGIVVR